MQAGGKKYPQVMILGGRYLQEIPRFPVFIWGGPPNVKRVDIWQLSHNQTPVLELSTRNHASRIKKAAAAFFAARGLCLTDLHLPGF